MTADNAPWVYDFRFNYYENYYRNRLQAFGSSGSYYDMWESGWINCDSVRTIDDTYGVGSVVVNNGIDIQAFVAKNYNGDLPECLTEKVVTAVREAVRDVREFNTKIVNAVTDYLADVFGTFICTATVETIGTECGRKLLVKMKDYRDNNMTDAEGVAMLRYYGVLGPRIVKAIDADPDRDAVYKYLYADYVSKISNMIDRDQQVELLVVYFKMLNEMSTRYGIKTSDRFKLWQTNLQ